MISKSSNDFKNKKIALSFFHTFSSIAFRGRFSTQPMLHKRTENERRDIKIRWDSRIGRHMHNENSQTSSRNTELLHSSTYFFSYLPVNLSDYRKSAS